MKKLHSMKNSTIGTIVLITFLAIVAEIVPPLKEALASLGGHHWVGKSIVAVVAFIGMVLFLPNGDGKNATENDGAITVTALTGSILMAAYFTYHYMTT